MGPWENNTKGTYHPRDIEPWEHGTSGNDNSRNIGCLEGFGKIESCKLGTLGT